MRHFMPPTEAKGNTAAQDRLERIARKLQLAEMVLDHLLTRGPDSFSVFDVPMVYRLSEDDIVDGLAILAARGDVSSDGLTFYLERPPRRAERLCPACGCCFEPSELCAQCDAAERAGGWR